MVILPAIITIIGNILFYLFIKNKVDKRIEQAKIAYSGVFKEKIDIYRKILEKTYRIKLLVHRYNYQGREDLSKEFFVEVEDYINFYLMNQPFLSELMFENLNMLRAEFQSVFESSEQYYRLMDTTTNPKELSLKLQSARNKLKTNSPFEAIEKALIQEMKADLFPM